MWTSWPQLQSSRATGADARSVCRVILATPEYHGSFAAMMKLVIENLGFPSTLAGKPVALLGVAAGRIGAIKSLEQLRSVCSHVGAIVLPGPVSVANVFSRTLCYSMSNSLAALPPKIRSFSSCDRKSQCKRTKSNA